MNKNKNVKIIKIWEVNKQRISVNIFENKVLFSTGLCVELGRVYVVGCRGL